MNSLIYFINSHDGCKVESSTSSHLTVSSYVVLADGTLTRESQTIPATLSAARDWLGY